MSKEMLFEKNAVIFKEGTLDLTMYDIISGKVGIYANYGAENEKLLTELGAGRYFGEMGVIDEMPRSATAIALEDTKVAVIDKAELNSFLVDNPEKIIDIFQNLSKRFRELSKEYLDTCAAIAEYVENNENKKPQKEGLLKKIKNIIDISNEAQQQAIQMGAYSYINHIGFYY